MVVVIYDFSPIGFPIPLRKIGGRVLGDAPVSGATRCGTGRRI